MEWGESGNPGRGALLLCGCGLDREASYAASVAEAARNDDDEVQVMRDCGGRGRVLGSKFDSVKYV